MKVKELRKQLENMNQNKEVYHEGYMGKLYRVDGVSESNFLESIVTIYTKDEEYIQEY